MTGNHHTENNSSSIALYIMGIYLISSIITTIVIQILDEFPATLSKILAFVFLIYSGNLRFLLAAYFIKNALSSSKGGEVLQSKTIKYGAKCTLTFKILSWLFIEPFWVGMVIDQTPWLVIQEVPTSREYVDNLFAGALYMNVFGALLGGAIYGIGAAIGAVVDFSRRKT